MRVHIIKEEYIMKLVPLGDRVVLKQFEAEETTKSGIILAAIYSKYSGNEVKLDDEEYIIVKQNDILAIVE